MIISIHHYELIETATEEDFQGVVRAAEQRELFDLPGLVEYRFLRGIKGSRTGQFTAVWIYENRQAWRDLWGSVDNPSSKEEYPDTWLIWEDELLAPILSEAPDKIEFTSYEVLESSM